MPRQITILNVYLPNEEYKERINKEAKELNLSASAFIRYLFETYEESTK